MTTDSRKQQTFSITSNSGLIMGNRISHRARLGHRATLWANHADNRVKLRASRHSVSYHTLRACLRHRAALESNHSRRACVRASRNSRDQPFSQSLSSDIAPLWRPTNILCPSCPPISSFRFDGPYKNMAVAIYIDRTIATPFMYWEREDSWAQIIYTLPDVAR